MPLTIQEPISQYTPVADPQSEKDLRGLALDSVGINNVKYPIIISGWDRNVTRCVEGDFSLQVSLSAEKRGIHMSRLLERLHNWDSPLSLESIPQFLNEIRQDQGAETAAFDCKFNWFVDRPAPETKKPALQAVETIWHGYQDSHSCRIGYNLKIPVTTLCPCSKEISDYGAHSQRGWVKVKLKWIEGEEITAPQEIFNKLQYAGSAPLYPLLKRSDERHVTMLAYDQPAFVEDTTRKAAEILQNQPNIHGFQLEICNEESIHTHNAVATINVKR